MATADSNAFIGLILGNLAGLVGLIFWLGRLSSRVDTSAREIDKLNERAERLAILETKVDSIREDLREIGEGLREGMCPHLGGNPPSQFRDRQRGG